MSKLPTNQEAADALLRASETLLEVNSLLCVIRYATQSGKQDLLNVLDMAEIGIRLSGEMAEMTEEWADLFKAVAQKGGAK
ncbi:hypothetical protein [Achromobacter xylosoxidans]|uniref:hypothetical protein n=1 Tax=Alcaligenes xylosoxydans xylosoxydans TaxID=85698 RepID=UPI00244D1BD7|nr:hypothetical protein [Achromobacter xylosoxidans]MDH0519948.1 hypothetical protein [Achromobacter xylosoxidans]MDH0543844.1 hypothetical protein [Achromobacter xylosoxidans]